MEDELAKSIRKAELEFREEPMDTNYRNLIVGIISRGRVNHIIKELGDLKGKTVLDAGCEAGHVSIQIAKKCRPSKIYAIDVCEPALDKFKEKLKKVGNSLKTSFFISKGQVQNLEFADNFFDAIICTEVIEHAPYPEKIFAEFYRVIKPDGKLIITFPNEKKRKKFYPFAKILGVNTDMEKEVTIFSYDGRQVMDILSEKFGQVSFEQIPHLLYLTNFLVARKESEDFIGKVSSDVVYG